ncbi:thiamine-monophosphate kinase [Acidianus sulfidivorans JP7]|uniref:Thiamine-monophosphate kinase n=1 Tax=Acidianus sulfidivorans JP7 TaxID=619593 RepID=A0A2U9IMG7_9CREN|nr:AIR synthase related protein [Acidianus sulfidivorans]AWR97212.1 thiamine-monophosphate kinase [Acidianus sulfidivorans JP7]
MKLKDIGEHQFIHQYLSKYINKNLLNLDVYTDGKKMYKIDGFSFSYFFPFMDYYDLGWKSVTAVASDIISSGGNPELLMSSVGIDPNTDVEDLDLLFHGIYDASRYYGFNYIGGDTNSSINVGWIDISGIGNVICNFSANPEKGDVVIITGDLGYTSKVFISYLNNFKIKIDNNCILKIKHPIINKALSNLYSTFCNSIVTATDISDGLLVSLNSLTKRLNKIIEIIQFPINNRILAELNNYGYNTMDILKYSGEEYETLIVVKKKAVTEILDQLSYLGFNPKIVGNIGENGNKLLYNNTEIKAEGWDNFKGWY